MDETLFFVAGGLLVVLAVVVSFLGLRDHDFPGSPAALRIVVGITALVVAATATGAVFAARYEQEERREEFAEFFAEQEGEEAETVEDGAAETGEGDAGVGGGEDEDTGTVPESDTPPDAEPAGIDGSEVFLDSGCAGCHTIADLEGAVGQVGPNLDESLVDRDQEYIRTSIVDPGDVVVEGFPAGVMPTNYGEELTEAELTALVDYLDRISGQ